MSYDAAQRPASGPAASARRHRVGDLRALALEAVDVAAAARGAECAMAAVVVVAVRDAVEGQRAAAARADPPRARGLPAVDGDRDPLPPGAAGEHAPPLARQRP